MGHPGFSVIIINNLLVALSQFYTLFTSTQSCTQCSRCCRTVQRGDNSSPCLVAVLGQDMVGLLGCQGTLLAHIQLAINQNPQVPFHRAVLQPLISQDVVISKTASSQVQNPRLALIKLHIVSDCPALQFVKISL